METGQKDQGNGGQKKVDKQEMNKPNFEVIKGLLAVIFGVIFVVLSYNVILGVLSLLVGLILLYYGFDELKITWVTKSIDEIIRKFRGLFRL